MKLDLKVSKDNVIAAINASVETTGEGPAQGVVKNRRLIRLI